MTKLRAIVVAWTVAVLTALPALWLYTVDDDMKGIQVCMFGTLGQAQEVKTFRSILFVLTYLIPGQFNITKIERNKLCQSNLYMSSGHLTKCRFKPKIKIQ